MFIPRVIDPVSQLAGSMTCCLLIFLPCLGEEPCPFTNITALNVTTFLKNGASASTTKSQNPAQSAEKQPKGLCHKPALPLKATAGTLLNTVPKKASRNHLNRVPLKATKSQATPAPPAAQVQPPIPARTKAVRLPPPKPQAPLLLPLPAPPHKEMSALHKARQNPLTPHCHHD